MKNTALHTKMIRDNLHVGDLVEYDSMYVDIKAIAIITNIGALTYDVEWLYISDERAEWNNDSLRKGYPIDRFTKELGWRKLS